MTMQPSTPYPARLDIDYQERHDRVTTLFRVFLVIPIAIVITILTAGVTTTAYDRPGEVVSTTSSGIASGLFCATFLMILAYAFLLVTDRYPPFSLT